MSVKIMFGLSYKTQLLEFGLLPLSDPKCRVSVLSLSINKMTRLWSHDLWSSNFQYWSLRCETNSGLVCMIRDVFHYNNSLWVMPAKYGSLVGSRGLIWSQVWWKNSHKQTTDFLWDRYYSFIGLHGLWYLDSFELVCGELVRQVYATGGSCEDDKLNFMAPYSRIRTLDWKFYGLEMMINSRHQKQVVHGPSMAIMKSLDKWCFCLLFMPPELEFLNGLYLLSIQGTGKTIFDHYCIR